MEPPVADSSKVSQLPLHSNLPTPCETCRGVPAIFDGLLVSCCRGSVKTNEFWNRKCLVLVVTTQNSFQIISAGWLKTRVYVQARTQLRMGRQKVNHKLTVYDSK